jgi:dTDP-4-dehydrorhamnose 3,5-epimerase
MTSAPNVTDLEVDTSDIDGLLVIRMRQVGDERGTIREFFRASAFDGERLPAVHPWRQINVTQSGYGAIRGLHGEAITKLVAVVSGQAFGAYVDTRRDSGTRGAVVTVDLRPGIQVLVPAGVCNGFQTVSRDGTQYVYCFDAEWTPGMSGTAVNPLDPALEIAWPVAVEPTDRSRLSAKDAALPTLAEVLADELHDGRVDRR